MFMYVMARKFTRLEGCQFGKCTVILLFKVNSSETCDNEHSLPLFSNMYMYLISPVSDFTDLLFFCSALSWHSYRSCLNTQYTFMRENTCTHHSLQIVHPILRILPNFSHHLQNIHRLIWCSQQLQCQVQIEQPECIALSNFIIFLWLWKTAIKTIHIHVHEQS